MLLLILRHWKRLTIFQKLQKSYSRTSQGKKEDWKKKKHGGRDQHGKIKEARRDLSRLETMKEKIRNLQLVKNLGGMYIVKERGFKIVIEESKLRITASSMKIKRYENRRDQLRHK